MRSCRDQSIPLYWSLLSSYRFSEKGIIVLKRIIWARLRLEDQKVASEPPFAEFMNLARLSMSRQVLTVSRQKLLNQLMYLFIKYQNTKFEREVFPFPLSYENFQICCLQHMCGVLTFFVYAGRAAWGRKCNWLFIYYIFVLTKLCCNERIMTT